MNNVYKVRTEEITDSKLCKVFLPRSELDRLKSILKNEGIDFWTLVYCDGIFVGGKTTSVNLMLSEEDKVMLKLCIPEVSIAPIKRKIPGTPFFALDDS